ncbi:MAG: hypothetical protein EHM24_00060 [Acidobacteria bacterium]|jgi:hypothetical protein|nr:MAG: hypothetical protein EHM24_00060 [Acidobacteriota bacterium]
MATTGIAPRAPYELQPPELIRGGVLSVATVVDVTGHELLGVEAATDACAEAREWDQWCTVTGEEEKWFDESPEWVSGDPFAVYAGVECDMQTMEEGKARAARRLAYAENRAVDFHVYTMLTAGTEIDVIDLGGSVPIPSGIGAAEAWAATVYGGVPTLLIPRLVVECACSCGGLLPKLDGTLTTCAGSDAAPFSTPVTIPFDQTSEATMFVTGHITLLRGPVMTFSVPSMVETDGTTHPPRALAERIYVPVFDCLVGKLEVNCG